jgi:hypothetical protein
MLVLVLPSLSIACIDIRACAGRLEPIAYSLVDYLVDWYQSMSNQPLASVPTVSMQHQRCNQRLDAFYV